MKLATPPAERLVGRAAAVRNWSHAGGPNYRQRSTQVTAKSTTDYVTAMGQSQGSDRQYCGRTRGLFVSAARWRSVPRSRVNQTHGSGNRPHPACQECVEIKGLGPPKYSDAGAHTSRTRPVGPSCGCPPNWPYDASRGTLYTRDISLLTMGRCGGTIIWEHWCREAYQAGGRYTVAFQGALIVTL